MTVIFIQTYQELYYLLKVLQLVKESDEPLYKNSINRKLWTKLKN
jgi:hypothetical protein